MSSDFGCYRLNADQFGVRVFGSEYTFSSDELNEFLCHLDHVYNGGAEESLGNDWASIPPHEPAARKGEGKISLAGLFGPKATITRRI